MILFASFALSLFAGGRHCSTCHPPLTRDDPLRSVEAKMRAVGTDQKTAANFATRTAKTGVLEGRTFLLVGFRRFGSVEPAKDMLVHTVLRVVARPGPDINLLALSPVDLLSHLRPDFDFPIYAQIKLGDRQLSGAFTGLKFMDGKLHALQSSDLRKIGATPARRRWLDEPLIAQFGRRQRYFGQVLSGAIQHFPARKCLNQWPK